MTADALRRAIPLLRCPQCGDAVEPVETGAEPPEAVPSGALARAVSGVRCGSGHTFDRARQGYLTLFGPRGRRFAGDTVDQVLARDRVLASGAFDPVADLLAEVARAALLHDGRSSGPDGGTGPVVLEAGAGTGYYLRRVLEGLRAESPGGADARPDARLAARSDAGSGSVSGGRPDAGPGPGSDVVPPLGIGTEISVAAARRLARADPLVAALIADTWDGLPLADGAVDLVQVVFAPRNAAEFARVLRPGGTLVVAGPAAGHLEPLRTETGMLAPEAGKADRLESGLAGFFSSERVGEVDEVVRLPAALAVDLALMGPSGVHLDRGEVESALGDRDREVRIHVEARTFRRVG